MLKINKQLKRSDGGIVPSGSIINYDLKFVGDEKEVIFFLKHYTSKTIFDKIKADKIKKKKGTLLTIMDERIVSVLNFKYAQPKVCTDDEWDDVFIKSKSGELIESWIKEIIDDLIGEGFTEII